MLNKLLILLSGKKTTILSILSLVNLTLVSESVINDNWGYCIQGILVILAGGANLMTPKAFQTLKINEATKVL